MADNMGAWKYDHDHVSVGATPWIQTVEIEGNSGYSYDPVAPQFYHENNAGGEDEVGKAQVPQSVRENLENTARGLTFGGVLDGVPQLPLGDEVYIDTKFNQGIVAMFVDLTEEEDEWFGSEGATPCLIVFATAVKTSNNHLLATGSHLDKGENYGYSYAAIKKMIDELEEEGVGAISFYVVGGEEGCNTNPNSDTLTMDYSRYYPFFDAAYDQDVTFVGQNFPSNPDGTTTTSAAITANGQDVNIRVWTVPAD